MTKQFLVQVLVEPRDEFGETKKDLFMEQLLRAVEILLEGALKSGRPGVRIVHLVDAEKTDLSQHDTGFVRASQSKAIR